MKVRYAKAPDYPAIAEVLADAFRRSDEVELVTRLRHDGDVAFELVAEDQGQIVGHVLFSRLWADRHDLYVALGPLAVRTAAHRAGIGGALVRAALESARDFGAAGVLVLGDPAYYGRFGFAPPVTEIRCPYSHLPAFQALALEDNAFTAPMTIAFASAFEEGPSGPI